MRVKLTKDILLGDRLIRKGSILIVSAESYSEVSKKYMLMLKQVKDSVNTLTKLVGDYFVDVEGYGEASDLRDDLLDIGQLLNIMYKSGFPEPAEEALLLEQLRRKDDYLTKRLTIGSQQLTRNNRSDVQR